MPIIEVSIKVDLPENFGDFQSVEQKVLEAIREGGKELMAKVFSGYEEYVFSSRPLQKKDRRPKTFHTLLGSIRCKRWRAKDVFSKKMIKPLDTWLLLEGRQKVSLGLQKEVVQQCVAKPYQKAKADIQKVTGVQFSGMGTWKLVQRIAAIEQENESNVPNGKKVILPKRAEDQEDPCPILGIDPDETYVRPRRKADKNHSLKLAVIYTGRKIVNPRSKKTKRRKLTNKQVIIGKVDGKADRLFDRVINKIVTEYGAHQETKVLCHSDGDPWIKRLKTDYLPQTLNRLDPYHVFEKMQQATGADKNPADWVKDFYKDPEALIAKVKAFREELADKEDREKVEKFAVYLKNNLDGMRPSGVSKEIKKRFADMYRRGSGTIESNVFWAICQRFKGPRMNWSKQGLENLCYLRERHLNETTPFKKQQGKAIQQEPRHMQELRAVIRDW